MSATLVTKVQLSTVATLTKALDLVNATAPMSQTFKAVLSSGTGAGKADLIFSDTRTILASAADDLDLAGGLTSPLGDSLTFVKVKALIVSASTANTNTVLVGGDAGNTFLTWVVGENDGVVLRPGATLALFAGQDDATAYPVAAGTGDLLRITNGSSGSTVDYSIVIIGTSA